ncbi:MAG: CHAT domain-containing protein [Deltaproteobacteria bacterium]|nr:CHAT domain-containing protein [Deltaproteobacteria bacterium]
MIRSALISALVLSGALVGCATTQRPDRPILDDYQLRPSQRRLQQPLWLVQGADDDLWGQLSATGGQLVFASARKGSLDIWRLDLTTGQPEQLTDHVAIDTQPTIATDGRIAFVSMRNDAKGDIYLRQVDGKLQALTDQRTADSYPAFSASGKTLYFVEGPEGQGRIIALDLQTRKRRALTDWGATHPAASPDGRWLVYTRFDQQRQGRLALLDLRQDKTVLLSRGNYHTGFPAFSADGQSILFSRFYAGPPRTPRSARATASLWSLALSSRSRGEAAIDDAVQLTSDASSKLFVRPHRRGLIFTALTSNGLDIGLLPHDGEIPAAAGSAAIEAMLAQTTDPRDRLLLLSALTRRSQGEARALAAYRAAEILRQLAEPDKQHQTLRQALKSAPVGSAVHELSTIDAIYADFLLAKGTTPSATKHAATQAHLALSQLAAKTAAGRALASLRRGDIFRHAAQRQQAIAAYQQVLDRHTDRPALAIEAYLALGELYLESGGALAAADYYVQAFSRFPAQTLALRRAAAKIFAHLAPLAAAPRVEALRALIDQHADKPFFVALAQRELARRYQVDKRYELAIEALFQVALMQRSVPSEAEQATFTLGQRCLEHAERLREQQKLTRASYFISRARSAYRGLLKNLEHGGVTWQRARRAFFRLSLLAARQLQRDGNLQLALKRFSSLASEFPNELVVWRQLIALSSTQQREQLLEQHRKRLEVDQGDGAAHYAVGLLLTYQGQPSLRTLEQAEQHLTRAAALLPRSPFPQISRGWIFEMRERRFGVVARGYLEEALKHYQRAYQLVDRQTDRQSEADLLVNLCNVFAHLGNTWGEAYRHCSERQALNIPFIDKRREATFALIYGRAASATEHFRIASRLFNRALEIARTLKNRPLESEILARHALNAQREGQQSEALRWFAQALALNQALGRRSENIVLLRSMAYNALRSNDTQRASELLDRASALAQKYTVAPIGDYIPAAIDGPGYSTAPFGFGPGAEQDVRLALRQLIDERGFDRDAALQRLTERLTLRSASTKKGDAEGQRELALLFNRQGLLLARAGRVEDSRRSLTQGIELLDRIQRSDGKYLIDAESFALQTAVTLNLAELAISSAERRDALAKLEVLERERERWTIKQKGPLLSTRLRLALWGNIANLLLGAEQTDIASKSLPDEADKAIAQLVADQRLLIAARQRAVVLLRSVFRQTNPAVVVSAEPVHAKRYGASANLWAPLSPDQRVRWHVRSGLNLATLLQQVSDLKTKGPASGVAFELLEQLAHVAVKYDVGALKFLVVANLAAQRDSLQGLRAAADGFLARHPLLLAESQAQATQIGQEIAHLVVDKLVAHNLPTEAWSYAERFERRTFVEDLLATSPRGVDSVAPLLRTLLESGSRYRRALADPTAAKQLPLFERQVLAALARLSNQAPRIAALFTVEPFPLAALQKALEPTDRLLVALPGQTGVLLGVVERQRIAWQTIGESTDALVRQIERLAGGAKRLYLDLGRVDPLDRLPIRLPHSRVATAWSLLDAIAVRTASAAPQLDASKLTSKDHSLVDALESARQIDALALQATSTQPADLTLAPFDLYLSRKLGLPLRAALLRFSKLALSDQRTARRKRVALGRLLHAAGVASYLATGEPTPTRYGLLPLPPSEAKAWARGNLTQWIRSAVIASKKRQQRLAIEEFWRAIDAMHLLKDTKYYSRTLSFLAQAYTLDGDLRRARRTLAKLLALQQQQLKAAAGRTKLVLQAELAKTETTRGWVELRDDRYHAALQANDAALKIYRDVRRLQLADVVFQQRLLIEEKLRDYDAALKTAQTWHGLKKAQLSIRAKLAPRLQYISVTTRLARLLRQRFARYTQARLRMQEALLQIAGATMLVQKMRSDDKIGKATAAKKIASIERLIAQHHVDAQLELSRIDSAKGDFVSAIAVARSAERLALDNQLTQAGAARLELVNNLYYLGAYGEALRDIETGLDQAKDNPQRTVQLLNVKGTVLAALGRSTDALEVLLRAQSLAKKIARPGELAATENNIGDALRRAGRFDEAEDAFSRALAIDRQLKDDNAIANDLANLGETAFLAGRNNQADDYLSQAERTAARIRASRTLLKALLTRGRMALSSNQANVAAATLQRGLKLSNELQLEQWQWRFLLWQSRALLRLSKTGAALRSLEQAAALLDRRPPRLRQRVGAPSLEARADDVYDELAQLHARQDRMDQALSVVERMRARAFVDLVARDSHRLAELTGAGSQPTAQSISLAEPWRSWAKPSTRPLSEVQRTLAADQALLYTYAGSRQLLIWLIRRERSVSRRINLGRSELSKKVIALRQRLVGFHPVDRATRELGQLLLFDDPSWQQTKRLVVIPSGPLQLLPFAALGGSDNPWLKRFSLSIAPSLSLLRHQRFNAAKTVASFAADPDQLPYAALESEALTAAFAKEATQRFVGNQATALALRQQAPRAGLLHIAAHAEYRPDRPLSTAFALHEEFALHQVLALKLPGSLAILSACQSALGPAGSGDHRVALSRAFLSAGAHSVASTLYRISDLGAALVVKHFARQLRAGRPLADALRKAQLAVRDQLRHPVFWAAMQLETVSLDDAQVTAP